MQTRFGFWVCALGAGLAACAAPAPTPAAPPVAATAAAVPAPPATPDAGSVNEPAPTPAPSASEAPAPEKKPEPEAVEKPSRPPIEILTSPDTAFLINYSGSAPLETARKTCSDKGGTDDEAIAKCMAEARDAFKADVLRFKKDGSHWSCIIYKRDGSRLDEVYSARVDLAEDSASSVKLKFLGGDKGMRSILKNKRDAIIQVPNDYSFVVTDAELGRLVYEAKVGLIGS
ncbi:MAG TPA: hypothetical protein VK745_22485 [Polyangiaceae bacterium]|nr:hypothetical protein [Polyangiaceae bacterium]